MFNMHVHPGQFLNVPAAQITPAPPLPSMRPPSPSILSIKNLVE
jgi:hypothetical protein